jgi:hypothetical protein
VHWIFTPSNVSSLTTQTSPCSSFNPYYSAAILKKVILEVNDVELLDDFDAYLKKTKNRDLSLKSIERELQGKTLPNGVTTSDLIRHATLLAEKTTKDDKNMWNELSDKLHDQLLNPESITLADVTSSSMDLPAAVSAGDGGSLGGGSKSSVSGLSDSCSPSTLCGTGAGFVGGLLSLAGKKAKGKLALDNMCNRHDIDVNHVCNDSCNPNCSNNKCCIYESDKKAADHILFDTSASAPPDVEAVLPPIVSNDSPAANVNNSTKACPGCFIL